MATTLEKLNFFHSELTRRVSVVTVWVRFAEMTGDRHYSERAHSLCKFSVLLFGHF